jgi:hypothetical protein
MAALQGMKQEKRALEVCIYIHIYIYLYNIYNVYLIHGCTGRHEAGKKSLRGMIICSTHRGINVDHGINVNQHSTSANTVYCICTCFMVLSVDLN